MEEIDCILDEIEGVLYSPEEDKHEKLSKLWTKYYRLCKKYQVHSDRGYQLYLLGENESFIIKARNKIPKVDEKELDAILNKINEYQIEFPTSIVPLTEEEVKILLDWVVAHTRKTFASFGINVEKNSFNGLCELGQALSILPLEKKGFRVTKNLAQLSFGYLWNHAFGTVTFPIIKENIVTEKSYLIDTTYLQFFTTSRCNEGRYDALEENTGLETAPDPGYFLVSREEQQFAKDLIENGYVELTEKNAGMYRMGFQKASLFKGESLEFLSDTNAKKSILETSTTYALNEQELNEIDQEAQFPVISSPMFY